MGSTERPAGATTTMTYYHASPSPIAALRAARLCVTRDRDAALEYASGHLYKVSISGRIADESDIRTMARELCPDSPYTSGWELLEEHPQVEEALIEAGYVGACYDDMTPDNMTEHETTVLFVASESATLTKVPV